MNDIEIGTETIEHHERVLFGHYFKIVEQNGYTIIAICKNCQQVIKDGAESRTSREYFRRHLRVSFVYLKIYSSFCANNSFFCLLGKAC